MTGGGITAGAGFPRRNPAETDRPAVPIAARREITPMELPIKSISASCQVRRLTEEDLPELLALAKDNPTYYRYMGEEPTLEGLRGDLTKLPPRTTSEDKYFLGYFRDGRLWGALDLILHFPNPETAFVGWFILRKDLE